MSERPPRPKPPSSTEQEDRPRLELSPIQIVGSALAATSAAVVSSFFGTAGTLAGAALVSVIATTGNAVYTHSLRAANARLRDVARTRVHPRDVGVARGSTSNEQAGDARTRLNRQSRAGSDGSTDGSSTRIIDIPRADGDGADVAPTRWRLVLAMSAGVFLIALVAIVGIELLGGKPLAALVRGEQGSGTTIGHHVVVNEPKQNKPVQPGSSTSPSATPSATPSPSSVPSTTPSSPGSAEPTPSASSTDAPAPTSTDEPSPSGEPTSTSDPTGAVEQPSAVITPPPGP